MAESWDVLGLLIAGLIALIVAIGRGWLNPPSAIAQWRSRYEDMRDDRDYWRAKAHEIQNTVETAVNVQSERLEDDDA